MRDLLALTAIALLALTGCDPCFNVECDAPDVDHINGLEFEFNRQSFQLNEVDNAFVLRFEPGDLETPIDTLRLSDMITDENRTFHIGTNSFSNAVDFTTFDYGIYNNSGEYAYLISAITTNGFYPTDCCCCYRNKEKTFVMNGNKHDRSGSTEPMILTK